MATTAPEYVTADRDAAKDHVNVMRALPERRSPHLFSKPEADALDQDGPGDVCLLCGYAEAGHLVLTDLERQEVSRLMNQRQPQPLMRRSILRKLAASWHARRARGGT